MTPELFGQPFTGTVSTRPKPDEVATDPLCICHHLQSEHDMGRLDAGCLHQDIWHGPYCDCDRFKASRGGDDETT